MSVSVKQLSRRAPVLSVAAVVLFLLALHATTAQADPDVVFLTTTTYALASDVGALKTACAAVQSNATALVSPATDSFSGLTAALTAASVASAYVSATMDTVNANMWMWRPGGDTEAWDGIVTSGKWAPNYPVNTSAQPYAVYSASLDGLVNVDGTESYPIACMYSYYVAPVEVPKENKKKKFPWWAILIIVLGSVAVIAAIVTVVLCCCCCKKNKDEEGEESRDEEYPNRSEGASRSTARRSGAGSSYDTENDSDQSSTHSGDTGTNRSFSTESAKESRNGRATGRTE